MKIKDIITDKALSAIDINAPRTSTITDFSYGAKRNAAHPEIAELLNARLANMLFNCPALARDEIELANFIINKLDVDPKYVPSETLLQAIRTICDKLGRESSMHGVIRTA